MVEKKRLENGNNYQQGIFSQFCKDCFLYDSDPTSTIDQERDFFLIDQLFVTYLHFMLNKTEFEKFKQALSVSTHDLPPCLPQPYGSVVMPNIKTLQFARISPLILKMNELRLREGVHPFGPRPS